MKRRDPRAGAYHAHRRPNRSATRIVGLAVLFLALALVMTRPDLHHLDRMPSDTGDPSFLAWVLSWGSHALVHQPLHYLDGNIFWPHRDALAYSDMMTPLVPIYGLAHWITGGLGASLTITNIALLVFSLAATYSLANWLTGRVGGALVGATAFTFGANVFAGWAHTQLLSLGFVALAILLLFKVLEQPRIGTAVALGAATAATALAALYYGAMFAVVAVVVVAGYLAMRRKLPWRRLVASLGVAVVVAGLLLAPAAASYLRVEHETKFKRELQSSFGLTAKDLITAARGSYLYPRLANLRPVFEQEHRFFPGFATIGLAIIGLVAALTRRRRASADDGRRDRRIFIFLLGAGGIVALVMAHGPVILGHHGLFWYFHEHVPGFGGIRATARFAVFTLLAVAMLAAYGFSAITSRIRSATGVGVVVTLTVLLLLAELAAPLSWAHLPDDNATLAVYHELRHRSPGAVVELPLIDIGQQDVYPYVEAAREAYSTIDWHPRFNGYSGFVPVGYHEQETRMNHFPAADAIATLRDLQIRYVIVDVGPRGGGPFVAPDAATDILAKLPPRSAVTYAGTAILVDLGSEFGNGAR